MKRISVILLAAAAAWSCTKEPVVSEAPRRERPEASVPDNDDIVSGWVRIKLAEDAAPLREGAFTRGEVESGDARIDAIAQELGATEIRRVFRDGGRFEARRRRYGLHLWYDIRIGDDVPVSRAEAGMASVPGVAHVQPIYKAKLTDHRVVPALAADMKYQPAALDASRPKLEADQYPFNDPDLPKQWHYYNDGSMPKAEEGADINLFKAWEEVGAGRPDVVVAVVDMGVQFDHPDLAANMWVNEAELNGTPGVDDDGNGYVDDIYGWNFAPNYNSGQIVPGDHGTHIAGTIAAVNNNGEGVCGVAGGTGNGDGVRIMSICWTANNKQEIPNWDMFAYAADNGAVIASCSWEVSSPSIAPDLQDGLDYFIDNAGMDDSDGDGVNDVQTGPMAGGLVVFAAGNSGANQLKFPGYYERVVSVASMAPNYDKASYSNYAPEVDILAPGGEQKFGDQYAVYSTYTNSGYAFIEGTSMATPHVSGVAALIVSKYGKEGFSSEDCRKRLLASFRPISPVVSENYSNQIGVGMVDASLITLEDPGTPPAALEHYGAEGLPDSVRIYCRVPADGNGMPVVKYVLRYAEVQDGTPGEWKSVDLINTQDVGGDYEYRMVLVQLTTYAFEMTPVDRFGREGETVSFQTTTLQHTNRSPQQRANFLDVSVEKAGPKYSKKFKLAYYFIEPDEAFGDALTFTVTSSDETVIKVVMTNGSDLELVPLKQGVATITVRATDKGGLYVEDTFTFTVKEDAFQNFGPRVSKEFGTVRMTATGADYSQTFVLSEYFTDANLGDGDQLAYSVANANEAIVRATVEEGVLTVEPLAEGTASVTVTATDLAGETAQSVMTVSVGNVPTGGGLQVAPNPAGEVLDISFAAAAGTRAEAAVYDSAARKVLSATIAFGDSGTGTLDVASLASGVYTLSVRAAGGNGSTTFLKR